MVFRRRTPTSLGRELKHFSRDCIIHSWRFSLVGRPLVQITPLQSIVLSCERVPGTLQPSECLGEFVQADGWARLPVTPLNPGSGKLRRTFLMSRVHTGVPGSSSG